MTTSTRAISKTLLDKEADARFWLQTHYKPGHKLDPSDPADRAMAKAWVDIYAKVKREDAAGRLVVTYNRPEVERAIADMAALNQVSDDHLDAAVTSPSQVDSSLHVDAAARASDLAAARGRHAAQFQPPTVSPIVVQAAAQEAAAAVSAPPPPPVVQHLHPNHPAVRSIRAQPILTPDIVHAATQPGAAASTPSSTEVVLDPQGGTPTTLDHATIVDPPSEHHLRTAPAYLTSPPPPAGSPDAAGRHQARHHHRRHQFSAGRAAAAPTAAVVVHEDAHANEAAGAPPPTSTVHPQTVAQIRDVATDLAQRAAGPVVGVLYGANEEWAVKEFQTADEAATWYDQTHDHTDTFKYLAYFDKSSPSWPASVNEVLGSSKSLEIRERVTRFVGDHKSALAYGVGTAVVGLGIAAFISSRRGGARRSPSPSSRSHALPRTTTTITTVDPKPPGKR